MEGPLRNIGVMTTQFQSFFNAAFRYTCLFHDNFLLENSISPFVSYKSKNLKHDMCSKFELFSECCQAHQHLKHFTSCNFCGDRLCGDNFCTKSTGFVYLFGRGLPDLFFWSIKNIMVQL